MIMDDSKDKHLTTASGRPYIENEYSLSAGPKGHLLLEDYILHEKMAHFNRERIPERVVHAKGTGAYGSFTVTGDISHYTKAKIFSQKGKKTKVFVRFSTVNGEKGSADTERDIRGFAIKFYTEEGNWDLVGNNSPVFFVKDPKKFGDFIHSQKRDPRTNLRNPNAVWDYFSLNPETLHQLLILYGDRGIPMSYRHMNGYGSHTFSFNNKYKERFYVKFHLKTRQGIKNLSEAEAITKRAEDPDFAQRDLIEAIETHNFPAWSLMVQLMPEAEARSYRINPFDLTKVWPHRDYPLKEIGMLSLNQIPANYFAEVEQAAFAPAHTVPGIGFSADRMLQGRILSYPDAHRYRLGVNYEQLPVNRCPFGINNYQRDGFMRIEDTGGSGPNYFPNSYDTVLLDQQYKRPPLQLESTVADWYDPHSEGEDDHYSQAGALFKYVMNEEERKRTIANIVKDMDKIQGKKRKEILLRQLFHFFRTNSQLGIGVMTGLGIHMEEMQVFMSNQSEKL